MSIESQRAPRQGRRPFIEAGVGIVVMAVVTVLVAIALWH
jgi:hypothetical protein